MEEVDCKILKKVLSEELHGIHGKIRVRRPSIRWLDSVSEDAWVFLSTRNCGKGSCELAEVVGGGLGPVTGCIRQS